jgi:beta-lactam-binding protein with PASTA domain
VTQDGGAAGRFSFRPALPFVIASTTGVVLAWLLVALYVFPVDPSAAPEVPNVVGDSFEDAQLKLLQAGFTVERGGTGDTLTRSQPPKANAAGKGNAPDKVAQQKPEAGSRQRVGTKIVLYTGGSE